MRIYEFYYIKFVHKKTHKEIKQIYEIFNKASVLAVFRQVTISYLHK